MFSNNETVKISVVKVPADNKVNILNRSLLFSFKSSSDNVLQIIIDTIAMTTIKSEDIFLAPSN